MDYILVSATSTSDAQVLDELLVQHALKSSLQSVSGQTASTYFDILAFLDEEGVPQSTGKSAQVILRVNSADKGNVLAAIAYSQDQVKFSIKQQSKFIVSLLPRLQPAVSMKWGTVGGAGAIAGGSR